MNDKNLEGYGFDERTAEEQREIARQGGKASGKARKKKADMRDAVQAMLDGEYKSDGAKITGAEAMAKKLFALALEKNGKQNIAAIKLIIELTSQSSNALIDKKTKAEIKLLEAKLNALTGENEKFNEDEMPQLWKALGEEENGKGDE